MHQRLPGRPRRFVCVGTTVELLRRVAPASRVRPGAGITEGAAMPVQIICAQCGVTFEVKPSAAYRRRCCSRRCLGESQRGSRPEKTHINRVDPLTVLMRHTVCNLATGCWLWCGKVDRKGYGRVSFRVAGRRRRYMGVHRLSYELNIGPIPRGLGVLHRCDTPRCWRPAHLWLGTNAQNTADMWAKGRGLAPHQAYRYGEPMSRGRSKPRAQPAPVGPGMVGLAGWPGNAPGPGPGAGGVVGIP